MKQRLDHARGLLAALARDFAPGAFGGERLVDELACLASVLVAIAVAHLIGLKNVGWAAFSAYIVLRASFADCLQRGGLRLAGTAAGVTLAWLLAPLLLRSTLLLSAALAAAGAVTLYLALAGRYGYAWLLTGLSFAMVLIDGMEDAGAPLGAFAQERFVDVLVGTGASVLVSAATAWTVQRQRPAFAPQAAPMEQPAIGLLRRARIHALQGAIALALIPWVWRAFHVNALSQSSITIMAVMMVPLTDLAAANQPAAARLRHRFLGCCIGGLLATSLLILSHDSPIVMTLAVCAGVIAGRHIENGQLGIA